jgi:hypothetical protein
VLTKRILSPNRKELVIDQPLKSKYHDTHLVIFTDTQLSTIDKRLNKVARNALGLTPSFPTKTMHRPTKEMGLGYAPLRNKATQMGIENLMDILNKPTDRGYLAYAHTHRVATTYQRWPIEAYEANKAKLPTLRVLSYVQSIIGAELEHIPNLQTPNHIAISFRAASREIDETRAKQRDNIPKNLPQKEYYKQLRNQCLPLNFSDRLLKHLAPLWEEGVTNMTPILEKHTSPGGHTTLHILNTKAMHANLRSGDQHRISNNLELAMSTLRTTLTLPSNQGHRKLPKPTTNKTQQIRTSWLQYINHEALPLAKHTTYETITTHISLERGTTKKQGATHRGDT